MNKVSKIITPERLETFRAIPVPSEFSLRLLALAGKDHVNEKLFIETVISNTWFSQKLLSYGNCCFRSSGKELSSIPDIINDIGCGACANLALVFSLISQFRQGKCENFDYQRFWHRSLALGLTAGSFAELQALDPEDFFSYGFLSNIGELALATSYPQEYSDLLDSSPSVEKMAQQEKERFGLTGSELSWMLLAKWQLPLRWTENIRQYKEGLWEDSMRSETRQVGKIFSLSHDIATVFLLEPPLAETFFQVEKMAEELTIAGDCFGSFFDRVSQHLQKACSFFDLPSIQCPDYYQIKVIDDGATSREEKEAITILVVDDDPLAIIYFKKMLAAKNRKLLIARDGELGLNLALQHKPNILITDWRMPKLNGIDLCKIIRKTKITQHMYIIMLTANESEDQLVTAFHAGADDYIVKPLTPKILQARVRSGERMVRYQKKINHDHKVIQRYATNLADANRKLQEMAMTDFLTGLPNRRSALARLTNLVAEVQRYGDPLSCLMIDIDEFKEINDSNGHDCGDDVLRQISKMLAEQARSYDMVSRWGGEEFLIISARSSHENTIQLAERLRSGVEKLEIRLANNGVVKITVSVGVASWKSNFRDKDELLKEADQQLYIAKNNGRNRVEPFSDKINRRYRL